jgi:hypothetical protein
MLSSVAIGIRHKVSPGLRVFAFLIALACISVLVTAAGLTPSDKGHGTHIQLGLPACQWVIRFAKPCPMCGMTTAFSHAADLRFGESIKVQPFGTLLSVLTGMIFWITLHVAATGSGLGKLALAMLKPGAVWGLLGALIVAWLYKVATWNG